MDPMRRFTGGFRETYPYKSIRVLSARGVKALVVAPDGREVEANLPRKRVSIDPATKQITIDRWLAEKVGLEKSINKHKQTANKQRRGVNGRA